MSIGLKWSFILLFVISVKPSQMLSTKQARVIGSERGKNHCRCERAVIVAYCILSSTASSQHQGRKTITHEYVLLPENATYPLYWMWTECVHFKLAGFSSIATGKSLLHFRIHEIPPVWKYKQRVSFHSHCLQLLNSTVTRDSKIALTLSAQTSLQSCVGVYVWDTVRMQPIMHSVDSRRRRTVDFTGRRRKRRYRSESFLIHCRSDVRWIYSETSIHYTASKEHFMTSRLVLIINNIHYLHKWH